MGIKDNLERLLEKKKTKQGESFKDLQYRAARKRIETTPFLLCKLLWAAPEDPISFPTSLTGS